MMNVMRVMGTAAVFAMAAAGPVGGAEFKVTTQIFVGDEEEPAGENLTLFQEGTVYDVMSSPTQITVFKKKLNREGGRFILLNPQRKQRTEIPSARILTLSQGLRERATQQDDPLLRFAANPQFDEQFDEEAGALLFQSESLTYRVLTVDAEGDEPMRQYREFSDWFARLGAVLHPGSTPPFPRLLVNASLSRHCLIPREVHLTLAANRPYRKQDVTIRSEHRIVYRHTRSDRETIDQIGTYLVQFEPVDLDQFLRP